MEYLRMEINSKEKAEKIIACMGKRNKRMLKVGNNITNTYRFYIFYKPVSIRNKSK